MGNISKYIFESEAESMLFDKKADLIIAVRDLIESKKLTQNEAAKTIGCTQSRVSRLVKGHIGDFTYDWLFIAKMKLSGK